MKFLALWAAVCLIAQAADNTLSSEERKAGFRLLFDGHSMKNWRDPASETPPGDAWVIEDGSLRTTPKPHIEEDLISQESFGDFELKFDWRISPRGNTGVKYRIQRTIFNDRSKYPKNLPFEALLQQELEQHRSDRTHVAPDSTAQEYTVSYEFQLIDDSAYPEMNQRDHLHSTGALYSMLPPTTLTAAHPPLEWNESRLLVKGTHFEHWINGAKVLEGSLVSDEGLANVSKRWAAAPAIREIFMHPKSSGPISLQHHGAAVWFKNIKIRTL